MGDTRDTLTGSGGGAQVRFCVAIQGYDTLLTNHDDTGAVTTAWSGTDWSTALTGLGVPGPMKQSIEPFRPKIEAETLQLTVYPGEADTFASTVFATEKSSGNITKLDDGTKLDSDDTTVTVHSTSGFASSGTIYIGTEAIAYTGTTATTFTGCTRGKYSPFAIDGGTRFGRPHRTSQAPGAGTVASPWVTDYPRVWIGRHIGVWCHVLRGDTLDTKAEAELVWAGTIADVTENEQGHVILTCLDARDMVRSCVLLHDQFNCKPQRGVYVNDGEIYFKVITTGTGAYGTEEDTFFIGSGLDMEPGQTTADELISTLNAWFAAGSWTPNLYCYIDSTDNRFKLVAIHSSSGATWSAWLHIEIQFRTGADFLLGFTIDQMEQSSNWGVDGGKVVDFSHGVDPVPTVRAAGPVVEYAFVAESTVEHTLNLESVAGTFIDQREQLPPDIQALTTAGETWGLVDMNGQGVALVRKAVGDQFSAVLLPSELLRALGYDPKSSKEKISAVYARGTPAPILRQVFWISGDGKDVIPKLIASTGTSAHNHATYDSYEYSLGAGVPWDLLGDAFLQSCAELFGGSAVPLSILIDTPTKLADLLAPELALRNAHLVLRDGGLVFLTPSFVSATTATHTLTEANKAAPVDRQSENRASYGMTRSHLVNHIKVLYGRRMAAPGQDAEYREVLEFSSEQSKTDHGVAQPITIKARNHVGEQSPGGDSLREMAIDMAAGALTEFSRPILEMVRSYDVSLFPIVPGDTAAVTDNHVRDPETGSRGITSRPCWVLGTEWNWATTTGRVTLALADDDRRAVYSPCAQVDDTASSGGFTAGYNSATSTLRCYANQHSLSGDADASYFAAGEEIEICELSPATPGSPTRWIRTIDSVSSNDITLTSGLSSPAFDSALKYRITSVIYSSADSTQTPDVYLADDADAQILDTRRPYIWAKQSGGLVLTTGADSTRRHEYPVTDGRWDGDGYPVHPGMHRAAIDTINNLIDYRTAPQSPVMFSTSYTQTTTSSDFVVVALFPAYCTAGTFGIMARKLSVAPMLQVSSAGQTVTVRVSASSRPPTGSTMTSATFPAGRQYVDYTHTGDTNVTVPTAQSLNVIRLADDPCTYITVEIKVTGGATGTYYGLPMFNLGVQE